MPSPELVDAGSAFVTGKQVNDYQQVYRGVPNPFGKGASAYEPNTEVFNPGSDPLTRGSSMQLSGYDAVDKAAADKAASDAQAADQLAAHTPTAGATDAVFHGNGLVNGVPFTQQFLNASAKYGVPAALLAGVARAESNFNPNARSLVGAQGLMQFMPGTASSLGVNPLDPTSSINGAAHYLRQLYDQFGNWSFAVAAYNAGPGAVQKYGGIPPYAETQGYVPRVLGYAQQYSVGGAPAVMPAATMTPVYKPVAAPVISPAASVTPNWGSITHARAE